MAATPRSTASLASPHRFSKEAEQLSIDFKAILQETEADGWTKVGNQKDVDVYSKPVQGSPLGLLKGVGIIEGYGTREVYAVSQLPGCRCVWDAMFESGKGLELLDKTCVLSYASTKAQGFVSSRELVVLVLNEFVEDGRIYSMSKSVEDPSVPASKGKVRATLRIMGWYFEPLPDRVGTKVTYITDIDLGGWIPGNVLKLAAGQIPLVVADVRKYIKKYHTIAFPLTLGGAPSKTPTFDHETSRLEFEFEVINAVSTTTELAIPEARYPNGVTIDITPEEGLELQLNDKRNLVIDHGKEELNGKKILIIVKKNSSGRHITVNRKKLFPVGAEAEAEAPAQAGGEASGAPQGEPVASLADLMQETTRRLEELEQLITHPPVRLDQKLGTAILVGVPIAAFVLARVFG